MITISKRSVHGTNQHDQLRTKQHATMITKRCGSIRKPASLTVTRGRISPSPYQPVEDTVDAAAKKTATLGTTEQAVTNNQGDPSLIQARLLFRCGIQQERQRGTTHPAIQSGQ